MNEPLEQIPLEQIRAENAEYFNSPKYIKMQERKGFNSIGGALIFQFILSNVIALLLMLIFGGFTIPVDANSGVAQPWFYPLTICVTFLIANTIPFIISAKKLNISIPSLFKGEKLKLPSILSCVIICLGVNFLGGIVSSLLTAILQALGLTMSTPDFPLGGSLSGNLLMIAATCVLAPITEEFIFRGVLLKFFARKGETFAIVLSALLFSLIHGNLQQSVGAFLIGLVFGYVAVKTKSILIPIIAHAINNIIAMVATFAQTSENMMLLGLSGLILMACGVFTVIYLIIQLTKRNGTGLAKVKHNGWALAGTSWTLIVSSAIYITTILMMTMGWLEM